LLTAFLDSNVIISYLRGEPASVRLFDAATRARVRLATSPIVLQELFAAAEIRQHPELLDALQRDLTIIPVDFFRSVELLSRVSDLRNRIAHSNDVLVYGSAGECDYFVTYDKHFAAVASKDRPKVVTPEDLLSEVGKDA
jgi:predicted nucleic acid-binding protein